MKLLLLFVLATQCRELWQEIHTNHLLRNTNFDIAKNNIEYWHSSMYTPKNKAYNNNIFCSCSRQFLKMLKYSDAFYELLEKKESEYCANVTCYGESRALAFKCTDPYGVFAYAYQNLDNSDPNLKKHKKFKLEITISSQNSDETQFFEQLNSVIISINYYSFPFINYTKMVKQNDSYKFSYDINASYVFSMLRRTDLSGLTDLTSLANASNLTNLTQTANLLDFSEFTQNNSFTSDLNVFRIYYIETRESYCGNVTNRPTLLISHISLHSITKYGHIEPWVVSISALGLTSCLCAACIFACKLLFGAKKDEEELSSYHTIV